MKIVIKRQCRLCQKDFEAKAVNQFWCSRNCNQVDWYRKRIKRYEQRESFRIQLARRERAIGNLVYPATFLAFANLIDKTLGKK